MTGTRAAEAAGSATSFDGPREHVAGRLDRALAGGVEGGSGRWFGGPVSIPELEAGGIPGGLLIVGEPADLPRDHRPCRTGLRLGRSGGGVE